MSLQEVIEQCSDHMTRISRMFKPGAEVTLIVRSPDHPDRDFMLTNDEPDELRALLERRLPAPEAPQD